MGFYKPKKTLKQLIEDAPTLLNALVLPSGVTAAYLNAILVKECGDFDTLFDDASAAATYFAAWSNAHILSWERMFAALTAEYNPISNYDRTDVESEATGRARSDQRSSSGASTFAGNTGNSGNDTVKNDRQGFNSSDYSPVDKVTTEHGMAQGSASATTTSGNEQGSGSESETRARTLKSSGNIGVTSNQHMLEEEISLRSKWTIYGIIVNDFKREICVGVY